MVGAHLYQELKNNTHNIFSKNKFSYKDSSECTVSRKLQMSESQDSVDRSDVLDTVSQDDSVHSLDKIGGSNERRGVLRAAAASVAAAFGFSTSATADSGRHKDITGIEAQKATREFRDPDSVRSVLRDHDDLFSQLSEGGHLDSGDVDELELDSITDPELGDSHDGERITAVQPSDEVVPEIRLYRETDNGILTIGIKPESDSRYAALNPHDDDESVEKLFSDMGTLSTTCDNSCTESVCYEFWSDCCCGNDNCTCYGCYTTMCQCECKSGCCNARCWGEC